MLIAVINESTMISNADAATMTAAIQIQMDLHLLPAWNMKSGTIKFYADKKSVPGYAWVVSILDNSTQAGALGYHAIDNGVVDAFIFAQPVLSNNGVALYDAANPNNVSVSSVLSHEVCEMIGDRYAGFWSDGPGVVASDGQTYTEYALELADAVEGDSYSIDVGTQKVNVSNFLFPSWFNQQSTSAANMPFDYLHKLSAPFTMTPGGYLIVRQSGNFQQVFGETMPQWKKEQKMSEWSRGTKTRAKK